MRWRLHFVASPDATRAGTWLRLESDSTELGRDAAVSIDDRLLSRHHCTLTVTGPRVGIDDAGSRNGTFHGGRRIVSAWPGSGAVLRLGRTVMVLEADLGRCPDHAEPSADVPGRSESARIVRGELDLAARSQLPVLLMGETGVGKEHAAREIHVAAGRQGPLVRVNIAAVPHNLFESELFGHVAGAFTGAMHARQGRVREAHGGTLVLDEIGELPLDMQTKLLRLLEERRVRPVGGPSDVIVDVRYISSTNANLDEMVRAGRFRRDLLARLRGHEIHLPRLAQRLPDLLDLADAVVPATGGPWRSRLTAAAVELLLLHTWQDNLRELRGMLDRAQLVAGPALVGPEHLPPGLRRQDDSPAGPPKDLARADVVRPSATQLKAWLDEHGGNIDAIAQRVGRHRRQIYRWLAYAGVSAGDVAASRGTGRS